MDNIDMHDVAPASDAERGLIEAECSRLIASFAFLVDHRRYAELVALFSEDGSFERPGSRATGTAALRDLMNARPTTIVTRHVCAIPFFETVSAEQATAVTYVTVYHVEGADGRVSEISSPAAIAEFHDVFRRTQQGWRIHQRVAAPVLIFKH